jgi:hypothetical protein
MECSDQVYNFDKFRPSRQATKVFYVSENLPPHKRSTQHSSAWEARRDDLTFYGEMKRVMIILRILGVLPYSTTSAGKSNFKERDLQNWFYILKCIAWKFYTHIYSLTFSISWNFLVLLFDCLLPIWFSLVTNFRGFIKHFLPK